MKQKGLISGSRRIKILSQNYGICAYCNDAPAEHVDHILPRSWKLDNRDENLIGACADCNEIAGNKVFDSFEQKQAYILAELKKPKWRKRRQTRPYMYVLIQRESAEPENIKPPKPQLSKAPRTTKKKLVLTDSEKRNTLSSLQALREIFDDQAPVGKVESYENIARRLSAVVHHSPPWSWRYVQSVEKGSVGISELFWRAVNLLAAQVDAMPIFIAETEPVSILARRGSVQANSILLSESKPCANPTCTIHFIPRVPWQKYCPRCAKRRTNHANH